MAGRTGSAGEVWSVRGVPADVRQRVADAAKARRMSVGEYVAEALLVALERDVEGGSRDMADVSLPAILERLERVERQLAGSIQTRPSAEPAVIERPVRAARPSSSTNGRRGGNPGLPADTVERVREMILARVSNAEISRALGIDASSVSRRRTAMKKAGELP